MLLATSCDNSQNQHVTATSDTGNALIKTDTEKKITVPVVDYTPTAQEKEKYNALRKAITESRKQLSFFLAMDSHQKYKDTLQNIPSDVLIEGYETIIGKNIEEYLTFKNIGSEELNTDLNIFGLLLGYSFIDPYYYSQITGQVRDKKGEFELISENIQHLIQLEIITTHKFLRYRLYEIELDSKSTPTKGHEHTVITVDDDGYLIIKNQKVGKLVDIDGELVIDIRSL